jgi:uncharacterized protein YjiK
LSRNHWEIDLVRSLLGWRPMAISARSFVVVAMLATGCSHSDDTTIEPFIDDGKADGGGKKLHLVDDHKIDISEPSDLTMGDGKLYAISDSHSKIYRIDVDFDVHDALDIEGNDLEALAYDKKSNTFLIGDEDAGKVWHIGADGERHDPIKLEDAIDGNSGIEGITFDDDGDLIVAKEKNPARIFKLDPDDGDEKDQVKIDFADDLSAVSWNKYDKHLYALSDEDHSLYRLNSDYEATQAWKLPVKHPEGLAFDDDIVYIVSDSEERLYLFELD